MKNTFKNLKCVAILGGTFNPVHIGHIMLADMTISQYPDIEKVIFMPNNLPSYKSPHDIVDEKHRANMLRLAINDNKSYDISMMEIDRGGVTYTIDTLTDIININPDIKIYFIIGADSLFDLHKWKCYNRILSLCTILAARRDTDFDKMQEYSEKLIKSTGYGCIEFIKTPEVDAASSDIRDSISMGNIPYTLLPNGVADYIYINGLYVR